MEGSLQWVVQKRTLDLPDSHRIQKSKWIQDVTSGLELTLLEEDTGKKLDIDLGSGCFVCDPKSMGSDSKNRQMDCIKLKQSPKHL